MQILSKILPYNNAAKPEYKYRVFFADGLKKSYKVFKLKSLAVEFIKSAKEWNKGTSTPVLDVTDIRLPLAEICVQHSKEILELPNGMRNYILDYINKNGKRRGVAVSAHPNGDVHTYFTQDIANLNNFRKGTLIYENK